MHVRLQGGSTVQLAGHENEPSEGAFRAAPSDMLEHLILSRRLLTFSSGATLSLIPAICVIVTLVYTFWTDAPQAVLLGWALAQIAQLGAFVVFNRQLDIDAASLGELQAHWRRFVKLQAIGSTIYVVIFPFLAQYAHGLDVAVLGIVGTAILCGVLLVHRVVPQAATFHVLALTPSLIVSIWT